ncbi:MAG TPA: ribonuclease P protein component [Candidatus Paceibacterota bacterium]
MPKENRLRRREFPGHFAKRIVGELLSISISPSVGSVEPKFSCVVSKKISPRATERNTLKRRCREAFRPLLAHRQSLLLVVYPKKNALKAPYAELAREAEGLLGKINA